MKNIAELINTGMIKHQHVHEKTSGADEVANVFNLFCEQLIIVFPASSAVLKDEKSKKIFKQQWLQAFKENGITKLEYLRAGLKVARAQNTDFLPSTGKFIAWCEQGLIERYGLPSSTDLANMALKYSAARGFDDFHEFRFGTDANYWLIIDLYQAMRDENLGRQKLIERADKLIADLAKKLMNGYVIPSPTKSLPKTVKAKPLTRDQQLSKIDEIKRKFGFNYASQQATTAS